MRWDVGQNIVKNRGHQLGNHGSVLSGVVELGARLDFRAPT
jgi:hypothetical protein